MEKIPTLYERDPVTKFRTLTRTFAEGLENRMASLRATAKWDGTCVKVEGGKLYPRYKGGFREYTLPFDNLYRDAMAATPLPIEDGTYELCGPKLQKNPHQFADFTFMRHGAVTLEAVPWQWDDLGRYLATCPYEGVVWWDEAKPVCKVKRKDYGHRWPWA